MPYDPNYKDGKNKAPVGGYIEDAFRDASEEAAVNPSGDFGDNVNNAGTNQMSGQGQGDSRPAMYDGLADVTRGVSEVFYGNSDRPGFIGGTYGVNPNAWWEIGGGGYRNNAGGAQQRGPTFNGVPQNQGRMQQQNLIQMLQQQAMGQGPSLAQGQLQQATDRNISQMMGMQASGRGPGAAGAAYQSGNMAAMANQQAAHDSAQLRMQEQLQTQGLLSSVLGQQRGMDQNMIQAQMQDQKMRDDMVMQFMKMGYDADQANRETAMKMEELKMKAYQGGDSGGGFLGGLFSGLS